MTKKQFQLFIPITKIDEQKREVYGLATAEQVDKSNEIFDYESSKPFYKEWSGEIEKASGGKSLGNVREMHTNIAAGKLTQLIFNDDLKQIEVCAKIVNESTWEKVREGVLTGFSHGGEYIKTWKDPDNSKVTRYTAKPSELSVVDNPCLGSATFLAVKLDGTTEMRKFKTKETDMNKTVDENGKPIQPKHQALQKWEASDGKTFEKKEDWRLYQLGLEANGSTQDQENPVLKAMTELNNWLDDKEIDIMTLGKKEFSDDRRKELAQSGKALPDGSFPIESVQDLKNAVRAFGRASDPEKAKAHIIARAKDLGATSELPDGWDGKKETKKKFTLPDMKKFCSEAYDAARAIEALQIIIGLICGEEFEAMMGEDEAGQVSDLKAACSSLKSFIAAEIMENEDEGMEMPFMEMSSKVGELVKRYRGAAYDTDLVTEELLELLKAGARHSAADMGHMSKAKEHLDGAMEHHGDAVDMHGKLGKVHGMMHETLGKMADCYKAVASSLKKVDGEDSLSAATRILKAVSEENGKMSDHMDTMEGHMDKADKHMGKMAKSHDGIAEHHDGIKHALKGMGAASEKVVEPELKKSLDELETIKADNEALKATNESLLTKNTDMQKTLDQVLKDLPVLTERLKKLESIPMPGKGSLFATGNSGVEPLSKGHEKPEDPAASDETRPSLTYGASPEEMRAIMNIKA